MHSLMAAGRPIGFGVLGLAAVVVWFALAPSSSGATPDIGPAADYERSISQALSDNATNDSRTESAPQQQVVNGWVARDLLTVVAKANADLVDAAEYMAINAGKSSSDQRTPALLTLAVLALAWDGLTRIGGHRHEQTVPEHSAAPA
jgi:hypothetical protein